MERCFWNRLRMILAALMVLSTIYLVSAQDSTCECYAYFVCKNRTWHKEVECQYHNEVCCELEPIPPTEPTTEASSETDSLSRTPEPQQTDKRPICGMRNISKEPDMSAFTWKIDPAPGVESGTRFGEFPWMAAILRSTPEGTKFLCGGSVIFPNIILTTAHTIQDIPAGELMVKTGVWNTTDLSEMPKHQDRKVLQTLLHPGFDKGKVANDVALLVLNDPLIITDNVAPVCLPSTTTTINETSCIATGWGADKFGNQNGNTLNMVVLPLVEFSKCESQMKGSKLGPKFVLHDSFICAGDGSTGDTCVGDGGGPLMCATQENPDRYVQIGITSWGVGCSDGVPGAYSSVRAASAWIEQQADNFPPISNKQKL